MLKTVISSFSLYLKVYKRVMKTCDDKLPGFVFLLFDTVKSCWYQYRIHMRKIGKENDRVVDCVYYSTEGATFKIV